MVKIFHPNDRWEVVQLPNKEAAIAFAAAHFIETAAKALQERGRFAVALSGGSTPKALFHKLSDPLLAKRIDWGSVLLFWGDERSVPPDHEESNYGMGMRSGLATLPLKASNIFRMEAESDIEVHAAAYEHLLKEKVGGVLDLTILGMGEDGHTASLFPGTEGLDVYDRLVIANEVPEKKTLRMSFTYPCINASRQVVIYVLGASKKGILTKALFDVEANLPIQKIEDALWITDVDLGY
ncbi:MAG: 6-phosphogluconolactonase [Verrucomicrobia bacterium]|nr:6-phosphogluconolactonase [Verrucomicrobiota bacterium]